MLKWGHHSPPLSNLLVLKQNHSYTSSFIDTNMFTSCLQLSTLCILCVFMHSSVYLVYTICFHSLRCTSHKSFRLWHANMFCVCDEACV